MKITLSAAAIALSIALLTGAPVAAQQQTADAVMTEMTTLGMDTEGMVLTEEQVLQIQAVLNDASNDDEEKVTQIEEMLGTN